MTHRSSLRGRATGLIATMSTHRRRLRRGAGRARSRPAPATQLRHPRRRRISPRADALVIKAVKSEPPGPFDFRGQIFVRGNIWSDGLETGMKQAAQDYGVNLEIGGPMTVDPAAQVAELESWIVQGVDCIMLTAAAPAALTSSINKAVAAGIPVVTLDSDAPESDRSVFVAGASSEALANAQIDSLARQMGEEGEWAFIIGQSTQVEKAYQLEKMLERAAEKYPKMTYLGMQESNDDTQTAADQAQALIVKYPNLKGIISNSGSGTLGIAQGIKAAGKSGDVKATGLTFATLGKQYVEDGTMPEFFLWSVPEQAILRDVTLQGPGQGPGRHQRDPGEGVDGQGARAPSWRCPRSPRVRSWPSKARRSRSTTPTSTTSCRSSFRNGRPDVHAASRSQPQAGLGWLSGHARSRLGRQ